MTVAELRETLEGLPDDMLVVYPYDGCFNEPRDPAVISVTKSGCSYGEFSEASGDDGMQVFAIARD